jgi:hypothetical protein
MVTPFLAYLREVALSGCARLIDSAWLTVLIKTQRTDRLTILTRSGQDALPAGVLTAIDKTAHAHE